jgi:hypothetical protein
MKKFKKLILDFDNELIICKKKLIICLIINVEVTLVG